MKLWEEWKEKAEKAEAEQARLERQHRSMCEYSAVLWDRISNF